MGRIRLSIAVFTWDTDMYCPNAALQIGDKYRVTTPVNWKKGDDVIVHPTVSNEEAKTLFPEFKIHKVRVPSAVRVDEVKCRSADSLVRSPTSGPRLSRSTEGL